MTTSERESDERETREAIQRVIHLSIAGLVLLGVGFALLIGAYFVPPLKDSVQYMPGIGLCMIGAVLLLSQAYTVFMGFPWQTTGLYEEH